MERIEVKINDMEYGWSEISMRIDGVHINFHASYLRKEPLASLVRAVYELEMEGVHDMESEEVKYEADVEWQSEPGFLKIIYRREEDNLFIRIIEAPDYLHKDSFSDKYRFTVPFETFKDAVIRESLRILRAYGIRGYYERWSDHKDFPLGMLLTLTGCSTGLPAECKLLNEYNQ